MSKAKYEEKFIVINKKYINDLNLKAPQGLIHKTVRQFDMALTDLMLHIHKHTGVLLPDKKYYVCNQDESYAQEVIDTILEGESKK